MQAEPGAPLGAPPRALTWLSAAVVVAGVLMAFVGAWRSGIAWDETYHVERMENYLDTGWYALDHDFSGNGPAGEYKNTFVYGPVTMILLHTGARVLGVHGGGEVATTPEAFAVRHLGVVLIGLVGVAAAAGIGRRVLGRGWGLVTAAGLLAVPTWTGHVMMNIKDVPVASGFTVATLALVLIARAPGRESWWRPLARVLLMTAGATLALGTRPGMWTALAASVTAFAVLLLLGRRFGPDGRRPTLLGLGEVATGLLLTGGLLVATYPKVFGNPVTALRRSASSSSDFRERVTSDRSYLFDQTLRLVPVGLLVLFALGTVIGLLWVLALRTDALRSPRIAVVGTQAFTLPLVGIVVGSDFYNGLRQVLFVAPAAAVLATAALAVGCRQLRRRVAGARARVVLVAAVGTLTLVVPIVDQAFLFPYNYAYATLPADIGGTRVSSDYWRTSVRELAPAVPEDGQVVCSPFGFDDGRAFRFSADGSIDCRVSPIGPLSSRWRADGRGLGYAIVDSDFYVVATGGGPVPTNCERLDRVTRSRHGRSIEMSMVARCTEVPPVLPASGIDYFGTVDAWQYAVRGWQPGILRGGLRSHDRAAAIAFRTPGTCTVRACTLELGADLPADVVVTAKAVTSTPGPGVPVPVQPVTARRAELLLPGALTATSYDGGLWLTFSRSSGAPLEMTLRSIRVWPD